MHDIRKIDLQEGILDENDHIAQHVREHMTDHGILVVNEMGAPGVGKTTTLKNIFKHMTLKPYVIEGDIESDLDTVDLQNLGVEAHQINTYGACHLDAPMIEHATHHIPFDEPGIMFIENIGNLVCPAEFTIGEHVLMLVSTVTEGSDKPYKYPLAFEKADIIIACAGNAGFDESYQVSSEATVADIGGDFKNPEKLGCKYLIPAIGGVGPLTRAFLMDHLFLKAFTPTL